MNSDNHETVNESVNYSVTIVAKGTNSLKPLNTEYALVYVNIICNSLL